MDTNQIAQRKFGELLMALTQAEAVVHAKDREINELKEKLSMAEKAAQQKRPTSARSTEKVRANG